VLRFRRYVALPIGALDKTMPLITTNVPSSDWLFVRNHATRADLVEFVEYRTKAGVLVENIDSLPNVLTSLSAAVRV
jgi:hypothetical protein